jgi:hypothetical protein
MLVSPKLQKKDGIVAAVNVIDTDAVQEFSPIGQSPAVEGLEDLSISLNSYSTMQDSLLQVLQDEDDNTETPEIHDNRILQLQDEDNQYDGYGGTSDAEGIGFDDVQGFRDDMMEAFFYQLNIGDEDVKDGILDLEDHATQCVVTNDRRGRQLSKLSGAPVGWTPPGPEDGWAPKKVNTAKGEVPFEEVDNPGRWSSYTFRPVFRNNKKSTGNDSTNDVKKDDKMSPSDAT